MDRTNVNVIPADTDWLCDLDARAVMRALSADGHQTLFVGGCVRNALLGLAQSDVDMSTDALPEQVMTLANAAGMKAIPTGIDHGTITVVSGGKPFEVTTYRRDIATDGRRAVVAFSSNIVDDARRRDFTVNALYATLKGQIVDPLGGLPDLWTRRIRFIEDAEQRIKEDYLRILRFFRFAAWYGDPAQGLDPDAMDAIARNLDGIDSLSAERISQEVRKLLSAPNPAPALAGMRHTGALHVVLPGTDDRWIAMIVHIEMAMGLEPCWLCRLVALGGDQVEKRLRFSKTELREHNLLREIAYGGQKLAEISYRYGRHMAHSAMVLRSAMAERMPKICCLETINAAEHYEFPLRAADLMPDYSGPALGNRLRSLEQSWIMSDFELKKDELLKLP